MDPDPNTPGATDIWADWLLRGRERGLNDRGRQRLQRQLRRLRDRVARGARLRAGQRVLDVGAGTGLIASEACRRVGTNGLVAALDVSIKALRAAGSDIEGNAVLQRVGGDAIALPFRDETFDAVFTRSVLIYVAEKERAVCEIYRVLRRGGRASIFEPINRVEHGWWDQSIDVAELAADATRIQQRRFSGWAHRQTMLGSDERDLAGWCERAGFRSVRLTYEYRSAHERPKLSAVIAGIRIRPNPSMESYEEAAAAVLGDRAAMHLRALARYLSSHAARSAGAGAFVVATK